MMLKKAYEALFQGINKKVLALIGLGTFLWSITMVKSGLCWNTPCSGIGFWGPNGHDGIWHVALAEGLKKGTWNLPIYSNEVLKNYHVGFDLLLAAASKITSLSVSVFYFQIFPPLFAFFIGLFAFRFVYEWTNSKAKAWWSVFFVYFGGNFGWIVTYFRSGQLGGESMFWAQQSVSTLINPPFALSLCILFAGFWLLVKAEKERNKKLFALCALLFGILVQIKIYAGLLILGGTLVSGLFELFSKRKALLMRVFSGALILSLLLILPTLSGKSVIVWKPFWFLQTMMETPDRLYWPRFASALSNYVLAGNWIKVVFAYGFAFLIFVVGNLGTRILSFFEIFKKTGRRSVNTIDSILYSMIAAGLLIPLLFVQRGTAWNTIQFVYYSLMLSGIVAGIFVGGIFDKVKGRLVYSIASIFVILITIPTLISTLWYHYIPSRPPAQVSNDELEALSFLSHQPDGVVLTYPFDRDKADEAVNNPPRPLYLYESTAYVAAYSKKQTFLEDEVNLDIIDIDWESRHDLVQHFFESTREEEKREFLDDNNISYIYLVGYQKELKSEFPDARLQFENGSVIILKVDRSL